MQINEIIHGFTVKEIRKVNDIQAELIVMEHPHSGAKLAWLKRDEENKTFSVAFKTVPEDDTGVFHILEHSVLNGSKKYPVREPFVELLKGSMQTFLNAMTFNDKTMYPVSSRNPQDFLNLMDVYLDAVFHPAIYTNPNIFYQEGWHYEIRDPEEEPIYKGVVFNEMKGAFSSVDEIIIDELQRMMFRDTCYQYVSGGDPRHIPDLSYEQFIANHRRFYHPSNAYFFLDGDLDIDTVLTRIDEVLQEYEARDMHVHIDMQKILPAEDRTVTYEIAPDEDESAKTVVTLAKIVGDYTEPEKQIAWNVISGVLTGSNETQLKKAIIDSGLGQDIEIALMDEMIQPYITLSVRNTDPEKKDEVLKTVREVLTDIVTKGIDREEVKAVLNGMEFRYHEPKEPSGVIYAEMMLRSWLYDGDPTMYLDAGHYYDELREKLDQGYFEELIREGLLAEDVNILTAIPSKTLGEEREAEEAARLQKAKESWTDVNACVEINRVLDEWQATPDTPEQLATLPQLKISDVPAEPMRYEPEKREYRGIPVMLYPEEKTGIVYFSMYFLMNGITKKSLAEVGEFADLLGSLPTEDHTLTELRQIIRRDLGGLAFGTTVSSLPEDRDAAIPLLYATGKVLKKNLQTAMDLVWEITQKTIFDKEMIRALLAQEVEANRQAMISSGHLAAMIRTASQCSAGGSAREDLDGYASICWVSDLYEHYDERAEEFIANLEMYRDILFNRERMILSMTGEENLKALTDLSDKYQTQRFERGIVHFPIEERKQEGMVIPAGIAYSAASFNLKDVGGRISGAIRALSHILTYGYLWNEVRVKGGAYGTGLSVGADGTLTAYSFRDPDPANTIHITKTLGEFTRELARGDTPLDAYIIGAVAAGDPLQSPQSRIRLEDLRQISGITYEYRKKLREELLHTTPEDFVQLADWLEEGMKKAAVCVVAAEDKLNTVDGLEIVR